jgi:serine/threonine protein kinase
MRARPTPSVAALLRIPSNPPWTELRDTSCVPDRQLGPWRITGTLGRGGNAKVYRVQHVQTQTEGALKAINARHIDREPYRRFVNEIETLRQLGNYPGILPVIDDHIPNEPSAEDQPWLVMPVASPLRDALAEADLPGIVRSIAGIADTLARLGTEHRFAHRDIKPANLYELTGNAVVGDFGLVALPDRGGLTKEGKPLGPANFMPFEMLNEPATADPFAADVYSLVKTLWVFACGVDFPPPGHQPASATPHRIADYRPYPNAAHLDELVDRATLLDPGSRPTMAAVVSDLQAWLSLPVERHEFDLTQAAAAVRERLGREISQAERVDRWKNSAYTAVRRFDELISPLNETLKAADPRAKVSVVDQLTDGWLKTLEVMGAPEVLFHWTRASTISAGEPIPYMLRVGRGIELLEDGSLVIRTIIDLGLDGVMQTDMHWAGAERVVPVGSTEQELALQEATAELAEQLGIALTTFAQNTPGG